MANEVKRSAGDTKISNGGIAFTFYCLPGRGHRVLITGYSEPLTLDNLEELLATVRLEMARRSDTDVKQPIAVAR